MSIDIEASAREVREVGFTILPGHLPRALMAACNEAFAPILAAHMDEIDNKPNRGPRRHYIALPMVPPFYDPRIFADATIVAIVERLLGEDMAMAQYATDTPLSHSVYQAVHADVGDLFPEEPTPYPPGADRGQLPLRRRHAATRPLRGRARYPPLAQRRGPRQNQRRRYRPGTAVHASRRRADPRPPLSAPRLAQPQRNPARRGRHRLPARLAPAHRQPRRAADSARTVGRDVRGGTEAVAVFQGIG